MIIPEIITLFNPDILHITELFVTLQSLKPQFKSHTKFYLTFAPLRLTGERNRDPTFLTIK